MDFEAEYKKLNKAQKEAVDTIDGPVMVVAGPGTGKTQVLAMRIANILVKTDTPPSAVLCLTFTNAGVKAMRERLLRLAGSRAQEVYIATFHHFAKGLIEKNYTLLDFVDVPTILADDEAVALVDELLFSNEWEHIRPRADATRYFSDLKSIISLLKRENMSPEDFADEIVNDIERITNDPDNISSRGARKGELKREAEKEIDSLKRTKEVVEFYKKYEEAKRARGYMDYDDVLAYAVQLVTDFENVRQDVQEAYLYVHVDEHQDSSGIQNAFLEAVWGEAPKPDIFVVGDDRQLIYAFNGASFNHFTRFRTMFGKAHEITLSENYRSSQTILDAADNLLKSELATAKLHGASKRQEHKLVLSECAYPRDEILLAGLEMKKLIDAGAKPEECALLVPKNRELKNAIAVLRTLDVPVAGGGTTSFFATPEVKTVRSILAVVADPFDSVALTALMLDPTIGIPPLAGHAFLRASKMKDFSLELLLSHGKNTLPTDLIARLGAELSEVIEASSTLGLYGLVQKIGDTILFNRTSDHDVFIRRVEVVRTFVHLVTLFSEKNPNVTIPEFLDYLARLEAYGHDVSLATFSGVSGVHVHTLHSSKGLEYENVWIAHLNEGSLMKGKRNGFVLPERMQALSAEKDEMAARRELYVAITRAKERCYLSWSARGYNGSSLDPAHILFDIPGEYIDQQNSEQTEQALLSCDPKIYVARASEHVRARKEDLAESVGREYVSRNVTVTLLNNFFTCPWTWYFRNMIQMPEAKSESLLLGTAVHAGIDELISHREDEANTALVIENALRKEYVRDEKLLTRVAKEAKKIVEAYEKDFLSSVLENVQTERSVSYKDTQYPHLSLYGKIDLSEYESESEVVVTDFKTGSLKNARTIEKIDDEGRLSSLMRQLAMYTYLIEGAQKGMEVRACRLLFVEHAGDADAIYTKHIGEEEIELLKKDIADYDELVRSGKWVNRECRAETYGKSTGCEYCALAHKLYE